MTWLGAAAGRDFAAVLGLRPDLRADYEAFTAALWTAGVDPALLELCRLRVAALLDCDGERRRRSAAAATAFDERKAAALDGWEASDAFSAVERAALRLTDGFVLDPHGVTDADAAALAAHLSPPEMIALIEALAVFDGFIRFRLILGVAGDAP